MQACTIATLVLRNTGDCQHFKIRDYVWYGSNGYMKGRKMDTRSHTQELIDKAREALPEDVDNAVWWNERGLDYGQLNGFTLRFCADMPWPTPTGAGLLVGMMLGFEMAKVMGDPSFGLEPVSVVDPLSPHNFAPGEVGCIYCHRPAAWHLHTNIQTPREEI